MQLGSLFLILVFCFHTAPVRANNDFYLYDILSPYMVCADEDDKSVVGNQIYNGDSILDPLELVLKRGICIVVDKTCISGLSNFLKHVLFPFLPGKDCGSLRKIAPPIYSDNFGESALLACAGVVYNDPLEQLFPPSESTTGTLPRVDTNTAKQSMLKFCLHHQEYAQCVKERIQGGYNYLDHLSGDVINTWNLEKAFDLYCENRDLIASQYVCVSNATSAGTCRGGVEGLLAAGARYIGKIPSIQICKKLKSAVSCRLETQLNQCSPQFVAVMRQFYNYILGETCYPAQFRPNEMTNILTCYANYSSGLQNGTSSKASDVWSTIIREMEYICKTDPIREITDCMYRIYESPMKPQDVFTSKLFAARNIKPIARRSCAFVSELKLNSECISKEFAAMVNRTDNCLTAYSDNVAQVMMNGTGGIEVEDLMCRNMESLKPCLISVFTSCDKGLGSSIGLLYDDMMTACNNPNYQIEDIDKTSSASALTQTRVFVFIAAISMFMRINQ